MPEGKKKKKEQKELARKDRVMEQKARQLGVLYRGKGKKK